MDANFKYQVGSMLGVAGIGGVVTYWLRAKIDVWRAGRGAEVGANQAPVNVLLQIVQNKEKESVELRADLKLLMTNHLEHDKQERDQLVRVLTQQTETLRQACEMMVQDRRDSAEQRKAIHERITQLAIQKGASA